MGQAGEVEVEGDGVGGEDCQYRRKGGDLARRTFQGRWGEGMDEGEATGKGKGGGLR